MEVTEFESAFKKAASGEFNVKIDETQVGPELSGLAASANLVLDKLRKTAEMKARADIMMKYHPLAISILNKKRQRIYLNKKYETLWRGTHDELIKGSLSDYDLTIVSGEHYLACFDTRKPTTTEVVVRFKDKTTKYLVINAIPLLGKEGDVESAFVIFTDNTDLHEKMTAAKEAEQRVDRILQENPFPLFIVQPDLSIRMSNRAFEKLTGYSKDRLGSLSMKEFGFKKNKGGSVEDTIRQKQRGKGESVIEFPSGTFTLEWYYIPLLDAQGAVDSVLVVYNDITDSRKKELEVTQLMEDAKLRAEALSASADVLENGLSRIANGDLSFTAPIADNDPLVKLKSDYNGAVSSIHDLVLDLGNAIKKMKVTTMDTSKSTQEISKSTEQVAIQTQRTSEGTKKQMDEIEKVSREISDLSASIEEIASTSHTLMEHAGKAAAEGNNAAELGKITTTKMAVVEKISGESVQEITALNERMKEISTIVRMIADISSQTNLLALNAAIEAARAGEHGRGFAVVASEVKSLAQESRSSAEKIEDMITQLNTATKKAGTVIEETKSVIERGEEEARQALDGFVTIQKAAETVANSASEVAAATEEQAATAEEITASVHEVAGLVGKTAKDAGDAAAATEESASALDEITRMIRSVHTVSEEAVEANRRFKLN